VSEHVTLTQLCCAVGPDLLQNHAGLAELGKQHSNNNFLRLCDSYCCKPFHLSLGSILLLRNLPNLTLKTESCCLLLTVILKSSKDPWLLEQVDLNFGKSTFVQTSLTAKPKSCLRHAGNQRL